MSAASVLIISKLVFDFPCAGPPAPGVVKTHSTNTRHEIHIDSVHCLAAARHPHAGNSRPEGRRQGQTQGPASGSTGTLAQYDTDGDGTLSETEKAAMKADQEARRAELIAKYDTDGDGVLNATERAAAQAAIQAAKLEELKAKFVTLDTDSSGGLTLEEFTVGAPASATAEQVASRFAKLDADADSLLSVDEFTAKPAKPTPPSVTTKFTALDADLSGGLSLTEFTAGAPKGAKAAQIQAAFTKIDADADGSITLTEYTTATPPVKPRRK